jgi:hypothetical protein
LVKSEIGVRPLSAWEIWQMDNVNDLLVGSFPVCAADRVDDALLAVFRDDMMQLTLVPFMFELLCGGSMLRGRGIPGARAGDRRPP